MAANAVVGALRVDLGLNSAQFQAGLKASQASLANFGKAVGNGLGIVAVAAAGAAAALGVAVKGAIDHADELSKTSQKIGMSVEQLSRLEYAARLSDVSLEQLTTGLGKFSKSIVEAATNSKSGPANVFSALGISIKDAAGNLRANDAIFADVADKFSKLEDGALKTSLAMQLFGKSGAELIPLLNEGKDGLARAAAEADRLGITISTKTAKSAERFNDTLTVVGQVLQGVVNKVAEAALPALEEFAQFLASPEFASAAQTFGTTLITVLNAVTQTIAGLTNAAKGLFDYLNSNASNSFSGDTVAQLEQRIADSKRIIARRKARGQDLGNLEKTLAEEEAALARRKYMDPIGGNVSFSDLSQFGFGTGTTTTAPIIDTLTKGTEAAQVFADTLAEGIKTAADYAQEIGDSLAGAFTSFADAVLSGVPAIDALIDVLGDLGKQLLNSAISGFFTNLFGGMFGTIAGGAPIPKTGFIPGITGPKLFAAGGISDTPAIFGDAGPEAAVPLPDGRTIPVTLNGGGGNIAVHVTTEVRNGNLVPVMTQVAGEVAGRKIKTEAPAAVSNAQRNRGMGG